MTKCCVSKPSFAIFWNPPFNPQLELWIPTDCVLSYVYVKCGTTAKLNRWDMRVMYSHLSISVIQSQTNIFGLSECVKQFIFVLVSSIHGDGVVTDLCELRAPDSLFRCKEGDTGDYTQGYWDVQYFTTNAPDTNTKRLLYIQSI